MKKEDIKVGCMIHIPTKPDCFSYRFGKCSLGLTYPLTITVSRFALDYTESVPSIGDTNGYGYSIYHVIMAGAYIVSEIDIWE